MHVKRYFARTAPLVLQAVRKDLGPDAVVIACWAREGGVEVLAEPARVMAGAAASGKLDVTAISTAADRDWRDSALTGFRDAFPRLSAAEASVMLAGSGRGD